MSLTPLNPTYGTDAFINILYNKTNEIVGQLNKYKVYTALLSQSGTDDPSSIVSEDTLNEPLIFKYGTDGEYYVDAVNPIFLEDKTHIYLQTGKKGSIYEVNVYRFNDYRIVIKTFYYSDGLVNGLDNALSNNSFEIRVYN